MNVFQMCSLKRIEDHFQHQLGMNVSKGSIYNFSKEAYEQLNDFEIWLKAELLKTDILHADEQV